MLETHVSHQTISAGPGDDPERTSMSKSLRLPSVPPHYLSALNAFYRRRPSLQLKFAGRGMRLAPTWLSDEPEIPDPYTITLKVDGDQAELVVSEGMLSLFLQHLDPALSLDALNPEQAALVVEYGLGDALETLEQAIGCQLSVVTVTKGAGRWTGPDRPGLPVVIYLERMGISWSLLRLSAGDIIRLCHFLDQNSSAQRLPVDVPLPCRLRVAAAAMTVAELRSLEPGDIILPDDIVPQPSGAVAVIAEHFVLPVEIGPSGYKVGGRMRRGRGSPVEWALNAGSPRAEGPAEGGLEALTLQVTFELAALDLSLTEVQRLAPGTVVPLARPATEGLDILANGRRIGRGMLVRVGDTPGVRVTRLFGVGR